MMSWCLKQVDVLPFSKSYVIKSFPCPFFILIISKLGSPSGLSKLFAGLILMIIVSFSRTNALISGGISYLVYCFSSFSTGFPMREVALSSNNMNSNYHVPQVASKQTLYLCIFLQSLYILAINKVVLQNCTKFQVADLCIIQGHIVPSFLQVSTFASYFTDEVHLVHDGQHQGWLSMIFVIVIVYLNLLFCKENFWVNMMYI